MKNIKQTIKNIETKSKAIGFEQTSYNQVGTLLATLCASKPVGKFLELGTRYGLSTVWIAYGMDRQSRLISVDNDAEVMAVAKEYTRLLEAEGFRVEYIEIIPRPTPMDDISHWLDIFANGVTKHLSKAQFETFKQECREILKETIYSEEEGWMLDYKRLRVGAIKIG